MTRLFGVELKKKIKLRQIFIVAICITCILLIKVSPSNDQYQAIIIEDHTNFTEGLEDQIAHLSATLEEAEDKDHVGKLISLFQRQLADYNHLFESVQGGDMQEILLAEIDIWETNLYGYSANLLHGISQSTYKQNSTFLNYLNDNQIYQPNSLPLDNAVYQLYQFIDYILPLFLPICILLFTHNIVSKEKSQGTLKFVLQQPFQRKNILLTKISSTTLIIFSILVGILLFTFTRSAFSSGVGSTRYPIVASETTPNSFLLYKENYVSLSDFFKYAALVIVITLLFYIALGTFLSVISPNEIISFFLSAIIAVLSYVLMHVESISHSLIHNIGDVIIYNPNLIITLLLYLLFTLLLFISSIFIFKRQNIYQ